MKKTSNELYREMCARFESITQRGIDANAQASNETRIAVRAAVASLMALKHVLTITASEGVEIPDSVMLNVAESLNRYDDCCTADCKLATVEG